MDDAEKEAAQMVEEAMHVRFAQWLRATGVFWPEEANDTVRAAFKTGFAAGVIWLADTLKEQGVEIE